MKPYSRKIEIVAESEGFGRLGQWINYNSNLYNIYGLCTTAYARKGPGKTAFYVVKLVGLEKNWKVMFKNGY